jgi:hypothetical protein
MFASKHAELAGAGSSCVCAPQRANRLPVIATTIHAWIKPLLRNHAPEERFKKSASFDAHEHAALATAAQSPLIITVGTRWQGGRNGSGAAEGHRRCFERYFFGRHVLRSLHQ